MVTIKRKIRRSRARLLAVSSALALAAATSAHAQSTGDSGVIQLDPLKVTGSNGSPTGPVVGYVAKNTSAGSKTNTPIQEVPQSVSVIGRDELDAHQPQKVDEALRYTAGVQAQPYGVDSRSDWIRIRGFDATQTGIFLDGLPLYQYSFGGFKIEPFTLERIEVLEGPASVLYGGSNPGGLVNLVSKMPTDEPLHYLETGINSWGHGYGAFDFGGPVDASGVWSYRLTGKLSGGGYETDHAQSLTGVIAPAVTYKPNDDTRLTVLGQYQHDDLDHTGGFLPYVGTVVRAPFGYISRSFYYDEPAADTYNRDQAMIGYQFEHRFNDIWKFRQNVRYSYVNVDESGPYTYGYLDPTTGYPTSTPTAPDNLLYRVGFSQHTIVNTFSADNQAEARFDTGALAHTLLFGLDYKYYNIDQVQASSTATPISASNPVYGASQSSNVPYLDQNYTMHQLGAYVQDQVKFGGGWIATLNGRYDRVWSNSTDKIGSANFSGDTGAFSGRAGLAYEFANGLTPYIAISRSFNPQIGSDAEGQAFKPEFARQYEAGIKYKPAFFDGLITASYFDLTRTNVLTTDPDNTLFQKQIGQVRSRGVEVQGKANVTEALKVTAAFTAYHIQTVKDSDPTVVGKRPDGTPEVLSSLWADYTLQSGVLKGLGFGAGVRYQGSSYADNQNTLKVPSATLFDAGIHYTYDKWNVALNVNNIFNRRYVASCDTAYDCSYGEGRVATLKASYKW
ncbi:TonB-dependent siderophore receptor [Labrys monachus]|uniref:Iron complex outermembrane receptor protein n=1 Tax=Labrys monachus TaxID=217067 RepID=A0ABU0FG53_9HYPH|nr:TonB-dependent siderophore receptor [Labrys monachus]MDQ0393583.1 iron complex outermembrane receptor protein [Labrys monachus]